MEQLELPELDLPILLHGELLEGYLGVSGGSLNGVYVVQHVDEHPHLVLLDVAVFLSV